MAKKGKKAIDAEIMAYGSWVRTWSIISQSAAIDVTMEVSEMGEQLSPNTPPLQVLGTVDTEEINPFFCHPETLCQ